MRPFGTLLPFEEAKRIVDTTIEPITRVETISIDDCLDRVLAEDVYASHSTPPFDRAAMDGYAVRARDTFDASRLNPKLLTVVAVLHAGATPKKRVGSRECIRIATGAEMPRGADAVVMVEDTKEENGQVEVFKSASPKANVAQTGEDINQGELVLESGRVLDPAKLGVLASQGISQVRVYEKPKVVILPTGEEISEVGARLKPGQIYDINSHTIAAVVEANGGLPIRFSIVGDEVGKIKAAIEEALKNDLVVISGGSSVGERDLLFSILEEWGEVLFHGVRIKPGKPTIFASVRGKPILGMPGYPASCLINAYLLLLPALRKMANLPPKRRVTVTAKLGERVPGSVGRRQFLPVKLERDFAIPIFKKSAAISGLARADGYIEIAENVDNLEKDETVTVTLF